MGNINKIITGVDGRPAFILTDKGLHQIQPDFGMWNGPVEEPFSNPVYSSQEAFDQNILSTENSKRYSLTSHWLEKTPPKTLGKLAPKNSDTFEVAKKTKFQDFDFESYSLQMVIDAWQNQDAMALNVNARDRTIYGSVEDFTLNYLNRLGNSKTLMGKCFCAGTPIAMAGSRYSKIEEIRPGDIVLSFDPGVSRGVSQSFSR